MPACSRFVTLLPEQNAKCLPQCTIALDRDLE